MNVILSHPTGNNNVRAVAHSLVTNKMLEGFYTTIATFQGSFLDQLGRISFLSEIHRRQFEKQLQPITHTSPWIEIGRLLANKIRLEKLTENEVGPFCLDAVYKSLDRRVALSIRSSKNKPQGVYAYEDGAFLTFTQAKRDNVKCIYDLPIAYWKTLKKILQEETERLPNWSATLGGGIKDSIRKLERKTDEINLADLIVCPSKFVADSIPEYIDRKKIITVPFGSPRIAFDMENHTNVNKNKISKPLRILFVGSMSQRKGLGDLFSAMRQIKSGSVELVVLGSLLAPMEFYKKKYSDFLYESNRPNEDVLKLMRSCDIFCLPSLVEGRALVMQEAMSQGLPLIITPNTGGADLIVEGESGFLIPIRSPESIAEKITWFLDNRSKIPEMGNFAKRLSTTYTWEKYGTKIVESISNLL